MAEERIGIFRALWRFFTFYTLRKALGIGRAADRQFTGSAGGIRDAYALHRDRLVGQYREYRDAVAQVELILEQKKTQLEDLNTEEARLLRQREGAITAAEQAKNAGKDGDYAKHAAAYERFQTRITEIEELQGHFEKDLSELDGSMRQHLQKLTELQAEIEKLPREEAEQIATLVSSKKIVELNDRLQNLQRSMDRGPIDAVRQHNKELTAKARISEKLAGADVRLQDEEYAREGQKTSARSQLEQVLSARRAERDAKSGVSTATAEKEDRPKI